MPGAAVTAGRGPGPPHRADGPERACGPDGRGARGGLRRGRL